MNNTSEPQSENSSLVGAPFCRALNGKVLNNETAESSKENIGGTTDDFAIRPITMGQMAFFIINTTSSHKKGF